MTTTTKGRKATTTTTPKATTPKATTPKATTESQARRERMRYPFRPEQATTKATTTKVVQGDPYAWAGNGVRTASSTLATFILFAVATAFRDEVMLWEKGDGDAQGRAKGGSTVETKMKGDGDDLPKGLKGQISKVARVLGTNVGDAWSLTKVADDDERYARAVAWAAENGSPVKAGEIERDGGGGDTWDKLLTSIATRANALNGDDRGCEETIARLFKAMKDGERGRTIARLNKIDSRVAQYKG